MSIETPDAGHVAASAPAAQPTPSTDGYVKDVQVDSYVKPSIEERAAEDLAAKVKPADADPNAPKEDTPAKPAKTVEQLEAELAVRDREMRRLERRLDRRTAALSQVRAQPQQLTPAQQQEDNRDANDSDTVTLTRAQLEQREREAESRGLSRREQAAEVERRQGVIDSLEKDLGAEKFKQVADDLDDAFGGLVDGKGAPKPALEAVFEADSPKQVIEYLADPTHADEADRISRMSAVQAGKAIARLEDKLKADATKAKPQPSNAPAPLEPIRGSGRPANGAPDPSDTSAHIRWLNEQERKRA